MIMTDLTAKDIMNPNVVWVPDRLPVSEATKLFVDRGISGAPVVDSDGEMIGVVSLRDIAFASLLKSAPNRSKKDMTYYTRGWEHPLTRREVNALESAVDRELEVKDIMTPLVVTVHKDAGIGEVADMMLMSKVHRVVVTDGDELEGIVTTTDVIRALRSFI
jgi:predicted transcriptional regulator